MRNMKKASTEKTEVIGVRVEPSVRQAITAIGKTPTELINNGLHDQIKAHTHIRLEKIYKKKSEEGWLPQTDWKYLSDNIYGAFESTNFLNSRFTIPQ